ncbi:MAG: hypothetical protein AAFR35_01320 [Pseudomonadota bacterium]
MQRALCIAVLGLGAASAVHGSAIDQSLGYCRDARVELAELREILTLPFFQWYKAEVDEIPGVINRIGWAYAALEATSEDADGARSQLSATRAAFNEVLAEHRMSGGQRLFVTGFGPDDPVLAVFEPGISDFSIRDCFVVVKSGPYKERIEVSLSTASEPVAVTGGDAAVLGRQTSEREGLEVTVKTTVFASDPEVFFNIRPTTEARFGAVHVAIAPAILEEDKS